MALIDKVLPGYVATLWMQDDATPTPLTDTNLGIWTAHVADIVGTTAGGTGTAGMQIPVEAIPAFGSDDASATYGVAGARTGACRGPLTEFRIRPLPAGGPCYL